ncbi:MAG TPA: GlsB/YeaQ/YmgE family stress response membrane protein [Pyrinomonadaceae bacterium]|jgi:uncharacterized membrane protein YeaQ/YmgE (transglycosylase-associated protein family)|nr:GlsB/YeaQ/YmgE family stress response membrane protein [Pyrinomonadaceae bacterium]
MGIVILVLIGLVVGWLVGSFTEGRGMGLMGNLITGVIGSTLAGLLFAQWGARLVGEGPIFIASLLAAAVGAIALILIVRLIKR